MKTTHTHPFLLAIRRYHKRPGGLLTLLFLESDQMGRRTYGECSDMTGSGQSDV